ncbi:MAG TPA: type II toxin-antitoxin system VapC family toxin [Anaerolineae bacterium]|nr:type II toxin-antitoxin system VapC family toxin [Anaerolineae bacterium]
MQNFRVCIDANLALKLVLAEEDSPRVLTLWRHWIESDTLIVAPPLLAYEVTSVLRGKVHRGALTAAAGDEAFTLIHAQGIEYLAPPALHSRAWELAKRFARPNAYDAHYLALAEMLACPFWTADERLYNAVKEHLSWVRWLGE